MEIAHVLEHWREFYLLVGTAGATLVALLFVAVSLGTGFLTAERSEGTRTFFSPVVIHFTVVYLVSAVTLVPGHRASFFAGLIGAGAIEPALDVLAVSLLLLLIVNIRNAWDLMLDMVRRHQD